MLRHSDDFKLNVKTIWNIKTRCDVMKKQKNTTWMKIHLILLSVLLLGACSSDDNSTKDEGPLLSHASLTMKIDGVPWSTDYAIVQTNMGEATEDEYVMITITGVNHIGDSDTDFETFGIHIFVDNSDFNNPKGIYLAPPPFDENIGYSFGLWQVEDVHYVSVDSNDPLRKVGKMEITDFEIEERSVGGLIYTSLSGTFEFEMWGTDMETGGQTGNINITEGRFNISETSLF